MVGAGNVGATAAQMILQKGLADVVMIDVAEGLARGKALDMMQMRSNECFAPRITATGDYTDTAGSDLVVVTAGVPRKPGMTREDLLAVNSGIVRAVLDGALAASPNAIFLFVTNPLDVMVNLAFDLAGLPRERLFGMGGVLDTARFIHAISEALAVEPADIDALVIGAHGEAMLPLPRLARVQGRPLSEWLTEQQIADVVKATVEGGARVVEYLQTGSAYYAPASSIVCMVSEILAPTGKLLSVCARLEGEYGISGVHLGVPARLGRRGVEKIVELPLEEAELAALSQAAEATKAQLKQLG